MGSRGGKPKSGKQLLKELQREGWTVAGVKGSHTKLRGPNGKGMVVIPVHGNGDLPRGTQRSIERQVEEVRKQQNDQPATGVQDALRNRQRKTGGKARKDGAEPSAGRRRDQSPKRSRPNRRGG
ncbi:type II toxin-antitoxin system HicA family toxin [Streptomonospora litoralis]|uniref:YcfA-like protein n=1 Tax=Streptomonospora litoralis TaxID=2498135 RepID=A0A4P6Q158_9ACTN|nr:type II toxin-antitoxin system HicA family toxin [Streptomonospora litoralis]QBI52434.1 YcfA-like protein [Streptomonospora litoralis]